MSAKQKFGSFLDRAKSTATMAGAQINQQIQARTGPTDPNAPATNSARGGGPMPSISGGMMKLDRQLTFSLEAEVDKAAKILSGFMHAHSPDTDVGRRKLNVIPNEVVKRAKGFAVFTVLKVGFGFSGKAGSGLVVARLPDGSWSGPSCIATGGVGWGFQAGADVTEVVVVLNSDAAVKAFSQGGNLTIGGGLSISAGPIGTGAQVNAAMQHPSPMFSYTRSKGLFAGVSIEGTALIERREANKAFYGAAIPASAILTGQIPPPERANALYEVIEAAEGLTQNMTSVPMSPMSEEADFDPGHIGEDGWGRGGEGARSQQPPGEVEKGPAVSTT